MNDLFISQPRGKPEGRSPGREKPEASMGENVRKGKWFLAPPRLCGESSRAGKTGDSVMPPWSWGRMAGACPQAVRIGGHPSSNGGSGKTRRAPDVRRDSARGGMRGAGFRCPLHLSPVLTSGFRVPLFFPVFRLPASAFARLPGKVWWGLISLRPAPAPFRRHPWSAVPARLVVPGSGCGCVPPFVREWPAR